LHCSFNKESSLFTAALTCFFSLGCALIIGYLDKRAEKMLNRKKDVTQEKVKLTDIKTFPLQLWLVFILNVFYNGAVTPFVSVAK